MKLPAMLKIVFVTLYFLWVIVLFASMPPQGLAETAGVLVFAAVIFFAGYHFHLFAIRAGLGIFKQPNNNDKPKKK